MLNSIFLDSRARMRMSSFLVKAKSPSMSHDTLNNTHQCGKSMMIYFKSALFSMYFLPISRGAHVMRCCLLRKEPLFLGQRALFVQGHDVLVFALAE